MENNINSDDKISSIIWHADAYFKVFQMDCIYKQYFWLSYEAFLLLDQSSWLQIYIQMAVKLVVAHIPTSNHIAMCLEHPSNCKAQKHPEGLATA